MASDEWNKSPPLSDVVLGYGDLSKADIYRLLLDHQRWLNSKGLSGNRLSWRGMRFEGLELDNIDLSYARIPEAEFIEGSVKGARFIGACLHSSLFDDCDVSRADFTEADLEWSMFSTDTHHEQACFENANLKDATLLERNRGYADYAALTLSIETPSIIP